MGGLSCVRCGRHLSPGSLKYVVHIKIYADFDGFLSLSDEISEADMDRVLEEIDSKNPEDLERDVYEEIGLLL
jgi:hypothetical protein